MSKYLKFKCPKCGLTRQLPLFLADAKTLCGACDIPLERISRKPPTHEEHNEQVAFIAWAKDWLPEDLRPLLFAIPNGLRTFQKAAKMAKREGMQSGVPDLFFAWPRNGNHGLFIEMKRKDGGEVSEAQNDMIARLKKAGYRVEVCAGSEVARYVLRQYMGFEK